MSVKLLFRIMVEGKYNEKDKGEASFFFSFFFLPIFIYVINGKCDYFNQHFLLSVRIFLIAIFFFPVFLIDCPN